MQDVSTDICEPVPHALQESENKEFIAAAVMAHYAQ